MSGDGAVFHRQKARLPGWVFGVTMGVPTGIITTGGAVLLATGALPFVPAIAIITAGVGVGALLGAILVATGVVRVAVSMGELDVLVGAHHVRIPISEITSVRVAPSPTQNRGIGVKKLWAGDVAYTMLGHPDRAVHIRRAGQKHATVFVCKDPDALADAIERARAGTGALRVRVEDAAAESLETDELAEAPVALLSKDGDEVEVTESVAAKATAE